MAVCRPSVSRPLAATVAGLFLVAMQVATAGDWPQILGPNRDGIAVDEPLATNWPSSGPRRLWERPVGDGFSGIVISKNTGVLFHRVGDQELVEAFRIQDGRSRWSDGHPTSFRPQVPGTIGPLATPAISDGKVVTFGAQGVLSCHDLESGELLWRRRTHDDFDAREGYFGAGSSPLVDDGVVYVNVGGFRSDASVVAFRLSDGKTLWHVINDHASYSSPVMATIDGQKLLIVVTRLNCVGLDASTGDVRFEFRFGAVGPTVNGANPVLVRDHLFLSSSYGIGAVLAKLAPSRATILWRADDLYSTQYCTPVAHGDVLFGIDGRQDVPPADLKCFDPLTQRTLWTVPGFGYGTLIRSGDHLLVMRTDGTLILATVSRERFNRLAEADLFDGTVRALPALAGGRLYGRDESTLKCVLLGAGDTPGNAAP